MHTMWSRDHAYFEFHCSRVYEILDFFKSVAGRTNGGNKKINKFKLEVKRFVTDNFWDFLLDVSTNT